MNPNVEAGVRAIFRRSLADLGLKFPREIETDELVTQAIEWEAPVVFHSRRWLMLAYGDPSKSDKQTELMKEQAVTVRLVWWKERRKARRRRV